MSDIQKPEGKKIVSDDWLSKLIGKPVYHLQDFLNSFEKKDLPENQMFIWSKIPVDDIERSVCLQKLGFYIVDTNIHPSISTANNQPNRKPPLPTSSATFLLALSIAPVAPVSICQHSG